jgi:RNA polymerase sigma-70 factor (ECF subfamily)
MTDPLHTASLHDMLARFRGGEPTALDDLIRRTGERLKRLARKMLQGFPLVLAREDSEDVVQSALVRLTRSLHEVHPPTTADFFRLAAEHLRRELLDLARHHRRRLSISQPYPNAGGAEEAAAPFDPPDPNAPGSGELDRWQGLHESVERLPTDLREVFSLTFYHGWTQAEIATLLVVSERQVRRLWRDACLRLNELLSGNLPRP